MANVFFNGPAGRIEGLYTKFSNPKAPLALLLHPHPLYGGTMNNKVIYNIYKSLVANGFTVLRINFRGVGRSQGEFDNGIGEMTDAATALDWLQLNNPTSSLNLIAGFSFGAWIAMQLIMRRPEINNFIAISPPVNKYDFSFLSQCPISGFVIQGDNDSIVPEESVLELVDKLSKQKHITVDYKIIQGADHFFRNKLGEFTQAINDYLQLRLLNNQVTHLKKDFFTEENLANKPLQKVFLD
ncbi:alpha/beta hydrolase [Candidatus Tisiphia endosymbiont of Empis tessellata]|uniref:alpha/beta hydrolase n=1 Tax=Candidatus Tisiphia endosymbiont of Empis tessellata TaxID=3066259 RepID=UPI00313C3651